MSSKLEEARECLWSEARQCAFELQTPQLRERIEQAARDFAAAEAKERGDYIASLTRQSAEAYAFRRVAEWLRAGGLAKEVDAAWHAARAAAGGAARDAAQHAQSKELERRVFEASAKEVGDE